MKAKLILTASLSAVLLAGCLPKEQLTGRVIDLTGPVPGAAVLGMVWIEETETAKPAPAISGAITDERTLAYEKDMSERGLPAAYARGFADEKGWFTLDKLYFSRTTGKAVKAMKQPRVTRLTVVAFQRGYLKEAITAFPKTGEELPDATMLLLKPSSWKELSDDSSFSSLKKPEYYNGYSKDFGATKAEKSWFLEYTHSNLWKAYAESDIKGDKALEESCGRDYSDIIVSTGGIQRNPAHEKCGELLKRMGALRENQKVWEGHSLKTGEWIKTAKGLVKQAIAGLGADANEPRVYAREIMEGMDAGDTPLTATTDWQQISKIRLEEAKTQYNTGDKGAAYKVLGQALYARLRIVPINVAEEMLIPAIKDTTAGFYRLMNRPLTAQLPVSDKSADKTDVKTQEPAGDKSVNLSTMSALPKGQDSRSDNSTPEEATMEISGAAYSLMPCQDVMANKCLLGYIEGQQGKGGILKVVNKNGDILYTRLTPRFREGWMRSDGDMVLVEHGGFENSFKISRLTLSGNTKSEIDISGKRSSDEFDYNAAGNGDLFAVNTDTVVYLDGNIRRRPQAWKDSVLTPAYWYLLPDASIIVSSGRARNGEKEETARIDINGKVLWHSPKALMLPMHAERRAVEMPKYLFAWGQDKKSISLVSIDNGEIYWDMANSADPFGISLIGISPSQRYIVLSVANGRPKLDLVIADTQKKEIIARKKLPEGLQQIAFDSAEARMLALCKIWSTASYRKDILKKRSVPAKLRIVEYGLDLKEKAKAHELAVVTGELSGEQLIRLSGDMFGVMDSSSKKIRVIKSHE